MQLTFKKEFAEAVKNGSKRQTIRPEGNRKYRRNQKLTLVTSGRFAPKERLAEGVLTDIQRLTIDPVNEMVHLEGLYLKEGQIKALAKADGFPNPDKFFKWFKNEYGDACPLMAFQLIRWAPAPPPRLLGTQRSLFPTTVPHTSLFEKQ